MRVMEAKKKFLQSDLAMYTSNLTACCGTYSALKPIGHTKFFTPLPRVTLPARTPSVLRRDLPLIWDQFKGLASEHYNDPPNAENVRISEMKMDVDVERIVEQVPYEYALRIVDHVLEIPLTTEPLSHQETISRMELDKGPGFKYRNIGFRTRRELLDQPEFVEYLESENMDPMPVYKVVGKVEPELLHLIVDEKKVRTFIPPPIDLLYWQLRFFSPGNENIKMHWWSYYGFNPFAGGVNRLGQRLLSKKFRFMWDVKGYDRRVLLDHVLRRRARNLRNLTPRQRLRLLWVIENTMKSFILLSNGDIVYKSHGNNSGSGTTTPNNIEVGMEMIVYMLVVAYWRTHHKMPTFTDVIEQIIALFGDDCVGGVDEEFRLMVDETFVREMFAHFGLELKMFVGGEDYPMEELTFLGFSFRKIDRYFFPFWDKHRLICAILYDMERTPLFKYVQKFYSLLIMLYPHQEFDVFNDIYREFLVVHKDDPHPTVKVFVRAGTLQRHSLLRFYLGLEAGGGFPIFLPPGGGGPKAIETFEMRPIKPWKQSTSEVKAPGSIVKNEAVTARFNQLYQEGVITKIQFHWSTPTGPSHLPRWEGRASVTVVATGRLVEALIIGASKREVTQSLYTELWDRYTLIQEKCVPSIETMTLTFQDWEAILGAIRDLVDPVIESIEETPNPLYTCLYGDRKSAAARIAMMFKEGGFNKYGNEMLAARNKLNRIKNRLNGLVRNRKLSASGADWLVAALDPFHDEEISCDGYPDMTSAKTVVQVVTQSVSCSNPTVGLWDCHMFFAPLSPNWDSGDVGLSIDPNAFYQTDMATDGLILQSKLTHVPIYSGYNAVCIGAGLDWTTATSVYHTNPEISIPTAYGAGKMRLVAAGFEVANTTAQINKQGSVVVYRAPSIRQYGNVVDAGVPFMEFIDWGTMPPTSVSDATLFPNSKTWEASKGVYAIATMNTMQNDFVAPLPGWAGLTKTFTPAELGDPTSTTIAYTPAWLGTSGGLVYVATPCARVLEYDVHGCIFFGLSAETTLQLTTKYFFERVPDNTDRNLVVLAHMSPQFDPVAMEIYSRALAKLPVGVPVRMNPLGEWFEEVMNVIGDVAPTIGSVIPLPMASQIGSGVGSMAKAVARANRTARDAKELANKAEQKAQSAQARTRRAPAPLPRPRRTLPPPPPPKPTARRRRGRAASR